MKTMIAKNGDKVLVDDADFRVLSGYTIYSRPGKCGNVYASVYIGGKTTPLHRFLLGAPKGVEVDHINRNGLDNRRANLRLCTTLENQRNGRGKRSNKLGFKGVSVHGKLFRARIADNYKQIWIGNFHTPKEAALAYDKVAKRIHGEFAVTNF